MTAPSQLEVLKFLLPRLKALRKVHSRFSRWDGALYNGGTALVLVCTTCATFIPSAEDGWMFWAPKILLGIATFWVALDRAKNYGPRWQFHIERENKYEILIDRINTFPAWPKEHQDARFLEIISEYERLRSSEANIPGAGKIEGLPPHQDGLSRNEACCTKEG